MISQLSQRLRSIGLKPVDLERLFAVSPTTVKTWARGKRALPRRVSSLLTMLESLDAAKRIAEVQRITGRCAAIEDGLYAISYSSSCDGETFSGTALAVMRDGEILGSDRAGGLFTGSYQLDGDDESCKVRLRIDIPPEGMLVNGFKAGPQGCICDVSGSFTERAPDHITVVDIGDGPIEIGLTYIGPVAL